jgi:signal transduction histidine kinase
MPTNPEAMGQDFRECWASALPLTTVQRVMSWHRGRIWAEGAVNRGATFLFTLGDLQWLRKTH